MRKIGLLLLACCLVLVTACESTDSSSEVGANSGSKEVSSSNKAIVIEYSVSKVKQIGSGYMADVAKSGYIYAIFDLNIRNQGYRDEFSTNPYNFYLVADGVKMDISSSTYLRDDSLEAVDLLDGGRISGCLAFEISENSQSLTIGYETYFQDFDITWIEL